MKKQIGLAAAMLIFPLYFMYRAFNEIEAMEYGASFWVHKKRSAASTPQAAEDTSPEGAPPTVTESAHIPGLEMATSMDDETKKAPKPRARAAKKSATSD
ncbi:hypothetical protein [Acidiphilium acidophilum]|uniref:Secreted protein n=1 Tax=Acidiphilium acidophilum TaxID=76588 RepID=A0AAW9DX48_ACIAO|nr:hypothetical protein [Acidiphilium acidophilum]MDX5932660.1 hypothetical protein [Acidiphilium acidophilum]GBQ22781.1 hypothetical protein AA700_1443 [Acidiphilium acidophilum DSM 700]